MNKYKSITDKISFDTVLETSKISKGSSLNLLKRAIENPISSIGLNDIQSDAKVVIVLSDNTRKMPTLEMVEVILSRLSHVSDENIEFVIATGTHKPSSPKSIGLPDLIIDKYTFSNHDSKDYSTMEYVGLVAPKNSRFESKLDDSFLREFHEVSKSSDRHIFTRSYMNSPEKVFINSKVANADYVISVGKIKPHYFGGFSGGAKNIVPGCSNRHFILRNHFYKIHPSASLASCDKNIVRNELEEAALLSHCYLLNFNVVQGADDEIIGAVFGHIVDSHRLGATVCQTAMEVKISDKYDFVVVTDDWPVTMSLKQLKKVASSACKVVRENGVVVIVGSCSEGLGSDSRLNDLIYRRHLEAILPKGVEVFICSDISRIDIELSGFYKYCESIEQALKYARSKNEYVRTCFIPNGSLIIPIIESGRA